MLGRRGPRGRGRSARRRCSTSLRSPRSSGSAFFTAPAVPSGHGVHDVAQAHADASAVTEVLLERLRPVAAREDHVGHAEPSKLIELVRDERPVDERASSASGRVSVSGRSRRPSPPTRMTASITPARCLRTTNPAARSTAGSTALRPSISTGRFIVGASAAQSSSTICRHSVTSTAASAPASAAAALSYSLTPRSRSRAASHRDGVVRTNLRAFGQEARRQHEARRLPHVVRLGLEREPEQRDGPALERAEVLAELADDPPLLQLVDLDHRVQQLEVISRVAGELLERRNILRETTPTEANPCFEERGADALVESHALARRSRRRRRPPRRRSRSR